MKKVFVLVDSQGNQIVRRTLKDGESHADVFKKEEINYIKKQRNGS